MVFGRLRELFRRISIRYSIFIYFTVTALAASVLIGVSLYIRMSDQISDTLEEENQILVNQLNRSVDSWLRNIMKLSDSLYYGVIKNADLSEESIAGEMTLLYDNGKDYVENLALFSREGELLEAVPADCPAPSSDCGARSDSRSESRWVTSSRTTASQSFTSGRSPVSRQPSRSSTVAASSVRRRAFRIRAFMAGGFFGRRLRACR